jgi:hypothetical protein
MGGKSISVIEEKLQEKGWKTDIDTKATTELKKALMQSHTKAHDTLINSETRMNVEKLKLGMKTESEEHDEPDEKPLANHPVHGPVKESDIKETMEKHNMTRPEVIEKLYHHELIHRELNNG